jgi:hypothetical protein
VNKWILATLLILGAIIVGGVAYQAGLAQSMVATADGARVVAPYAYGHPYGFGWGFGFGFLGLLFPILFLFLIFGLVRAAFGPRHWGGPGPWREGPRTMFEDWHRQAHGEPSPRGEPRRPGGEASSSST